MAILTVPADSWATIPDIGTDVVIEARGKSVYIDTSGILTYANRAQGVALPGTESIVIQASVLAGGVQVTSASIKEASVFYGSI